MKIKEIRQKSDTELLKLLNEKKSALRQDRFGVAGSKNKNVKFSKNAKRDIARIMTILRENEIKKHAGE